MRQATNSEIRNYLSHNEGSRKVRISRDGKVNYHGSRSDTDRSEDYWHAAGHVEDYKTDIKGQVFK